MASVSITHDAYRVIAALIVTAPGCNKYNGQISSVPPARSTRVGALDSIRNGFLILLRFDVPVYGQHNAATPAAGQLFGGWCCASKQLLVANKYPRICHPSARFIELKD